MERQLTPTPSPLRPAPPCRPLHVTPHPDIPRQLAAGGNGVEGLADVHDLRLPVSHGPHRPPPTPTTTLQGMDYIPRQLSRAQTLDSLSSIAHTAPNTHTTPQRHGLHPAPAAARLDL